MAQLNRCNDLHVCFLQAKSDPEKFMTFYHKYSQNIKEGVLEDAHSGSQYKDMMLPLLRYVHYKSVLFSVSW